MTDMLRVGIIGCGNISASYLEMAPRFSAFTIVAVSDMDMAKANARSLEYNVPALTVEELLASSKVDLIINLTVPSAHKDVSQSILEAGKHVYSEKPFVLTLKDAKALSRLADERGLRIGSAPDTFLGASHQLARHLIDSGAVGRVTSGTAIVMSHGMEDWHPNPDFFYLKGGGPILDLGPYYICNLVQLLGPVERVTSITGAAHTTRTINNGPRISEAVPVETPTTIHAILKFESGAIITLIASWDVWSNQHPVMELYGTEGTMDVPDPNYFGGTVRNSSADGVSKVESWDHPFGVPNFKDVGAPFEERANYRGAGLADMAVAIATGRPHRCNDAFATHVIEVTTAILQAGEDNLVIPMTTTCTRPAPLDPGQAQMLLV